MHTVPDVQDTPVRTAAVARAGVGADRIDQAATDAPSALAVDSRSTDVIAAQRTMEQRHPTVRDTHASLLARRCIASETIRTARE